MRIISVERIIFEDDVQAGNFTPDELRVIDHMSDGEIVHPTQQVADDCGLPIEKVRSIMASLRACGLARSGYLTNDEGQLCGRGTWLTGEGLKIRDRAKPFERMA